eukprot:TRINITY_DN3451_c0_g3_i1.p1 TRINITY_DN3451_c0_g3~~TRINITY_DN3451_c0_g3_i1.p1  ORF type:complete len:896 (-),score=256.68 TRINITY_DN3451_c0_g3_i1:83-2770(-)
MPGVFGGKYQGPIGAVLASKDGEVQALIKNVASFKSHLDRIMLCIDELSGTYIDLCSEVGSFYKNDPHGLANNVTEGYKKVTESMANVVPKKVNEILRTKVLKSCDEWTVKLEDVRKTQESKELLATAERVQHYVEKVEKARDHKSGARNQDKLNAATNAYEAVAAPIMKEMDLVLVAQKAEYSKLVVRVMQFQQAYFKQAFNSCEMMPLMDTLRDLVETNAWEAGEAERIRQAAAAASGGGGAVKDSSEEEFDSSDEEILKSRSPSAKKPANAEVIAFTKLADDLEEMFWGGRTPRERDLTAMKDAMYELNSKLLGCPKSNRKELRARIDSLDSKWKQAVDVHMKLGLTGKSGAPAAYTGGIHKPAPAAAPVQPTVDSGPDISSVPEEHLEMLHNDPSLAPEFDQMYGDGAAAKLLGIAPRSTAAVEITPSAEHVDMLLKDPSLAAKFDNFYGEGAAQRTLAAAAGTAEPEPEEATTSAIPPEHADMLRTDPSLAEEFDRMYGSGSSEQVLATPLSEQKFSAPPDHVAKLRADPSLGARFDVKYGAGASHYYLGGTVAAAPVMQQPEPLNMQVGMLNQGEMQLAAAEVAKQAALERYQQKRQEASPRSPGENLMGNGQEYQAIGGLQDTGLMGMEAQSPYGSSQMADTPMAPMGSTDALGCYGGLPQYTEPEPAAAYTGLQPEPTAAYGQQQSEPAASYTGLQYTEPEPAAYTALQPEPAPYGQQQQYTEPEPAASAPHMMAEPPPQEHIDMLLADPSFAEQFDEVYGMGSSQYFLANSAVTYQEPLSSDSSAGSPMMSAQPPVRESFDYSNDQDSDDDIIHSSAPVQSMMMPQPTTVSDYDFFPEASPASPQAPPAGVSPEDSQSPRTVRWRQVNQQRVAMGLAAKPHPGFKM